MLQKYFSIFFWLGAATLFGGLLALGPVAAPIVFNTARDAHISMPGIASPPLDVSRQAAGELFGNILYRFAWVEAASLALMLAGIGGWMLYSPKISRCIWIIAILWIFVAACFVYDTFVLRPQVWSLRQTVREEAPAHAADIADSPWPARQQFDALHRRDERLGQFKVWSVFAMVILGASRGTCRKDTSATPQEQAAPPV